MEEDRLCNPSYRTRRLVLILLSAGVLVFSSCGSHFVRPSRESPLTYAEHIRLAVVYEARGAFGPAIREYREALKLNPAGARAYFGLGNVYLKMGNHAEAERLYLKAIELEPSSGVFYNNLGWVYIETGRYTDAYVTISRGLTLDPLRSYIYLDSLGVIEMKRGNLKEAEQLFKDALMRTPAFNTQAMLRIQEHLLRLYTLTGEREKLEETKKNIENLKRGIPVVP